MFALIGLGVGETALTATASSGAVWDVCTIHVHMPRSRQLPPFDLLLANYPGDEESSDDFRARIGGQVATPQLTNTCTLRLSEAFNHAGQPIPRGRRHLLTVEGADDLFYAFRVAEFKQYMLDIYGPPDIVRLPVRPARCGIDPAAFSQRRGVMCFEVHFADATGHFTLWDGMKAIHGDYFDRAWRASLWMAG